MIWSVRDKISALFVFVSFSISFSNFASVFFAICSYKDACVCIISSPFFIYYCLFNGFISFTFNCLELFVTFLGTILRFFKIVNRLFNRLLSFDKFFYDIHKYFVCGGCEFHNFVELLFQRR